MSNIVLSILIVLYIWFFVDMIRFMCDTGNYTNGEQKEKEMKLWSKKKKLTATDDLVNFILMKLYEEPDEWKLDKYDSTIQWWKYKKVGIYVGFTRLGEVQDGNGAVEISRKQSKRIAAATANLRSAKALRKMLKAAVGNVT